VKLGLGLEEGAFRSDSPLSIEARKVELPPSLREAARFDVRYSDLDMNLHANNTRYAQWVLDSLPPGWRRAFELTEYEVNFLAEAREGDSVAIRSTASAEKGQKGEAWFQGWRDSDSKAVFSAKLLASPRQG
jgi:medium-chain acyl-[acyl-carrier-protein] hydrolase